MLEFDYFCEKCRRRRKSIHRKSICRVPKVLVIQLKRFSQYSAKKNACLVKVPTSLCLDSLISDKTGVSEEFLGKTCSLAAVILHKGRLDSGHYSCHVSAGRANWVSYDDEEVESGPRQRYLTVGCDLPYILIYSFP
jgi:ubiquitin carboxyl-terminal hydrolase 22/27/51